MHRNKKYPVGIFISMVELSHLYSNPFLKIVKFKESLQKEASVSVKSNISEDRVENKHGETEVKKYRQKQKILSDEEIEQLAIRYRAGENTNQLAKAYGVHRTTVCNNLKKAGVNVTIQKEGEAFEADEVIRLYVEEGMKSKDIGKRFDVGEQTIRKCLNEHGVKMRTRWDYPRE